MAASRRARAPQQRRAGRAVRYAREPGHGVIGMRVRDDGAIHRRHGIDVEIARRAIQSGLAQFEKRHYPIMGLCERSEPPFPNPSS